MKESEATLQEIDRLRDLNERLLDASQNLLLRLISIQRKSGIPIDPETMGLVATVRKTLGQMSADSLQGNEQRRNRRRLDRTSAIALNN